ncbi:unnamed protein product [Arabis nemorensis]|uniref:Uncharacterized protein n=1 Tax=Arabis nemorensis TaxID=586526 RepID=A0A565BCQ6_9BRAS|nr:unnamed protein product [Arabis nemorensis]
MVEEDIWNQEIYSDQSMNAEDAYMNEPWSEAEEDYGHDLDREEPEPEPPDHF